VTTPAQRDQVLERVLVTAFGDRPDVVNLELSRRAAGCAALVVSLSRSSPSLLPGSATPRSPCSLLARALALVGTAAGDAPAPNPRRFVDPAAGRTEPLHRSAKASRMRLTSLHSPIRSTVDVETAATARSLCFGPPGRQRPCVPTACFRHTALAVPSAALPSRAGSAASRPGRSRAAPSCHAGARARADDVGSGYRVRARRSRDRGAAESRRIVLLTPLIQVAEAHREALRVRLNVRAVETQPAATLDHPGDRLTPE
jgi:hypothetical protein